MDKFILISHQGSGTNLFRSLINSHDSIVCFGEVFHNANKNKLGHDYESSKEIISKVYNREDCEQVTGFTLMYNQTSFEMYEYIKNSGYKIIHLVRDPARTFVYGLDFDKNESFNTEDILEHTHFSRSFEGFTDLFLQESNECMKLRYAEMTKGKQIEKMPKDIVSKICEFLSVEKQEMTMVKEHCNQDRLTKSH